MTRKLQEYGPGLQHVPNNAPIEDILFLIKRDGGVVVKGLVSAEAVDRAHADVRETLDGDAEWNGEFFPSMGTIITFPWLFTSLVTKDVSYYRGNQTGFVSDRQKLDIHKDPGHESRVPGCLCPFPDHQKLVLVGRETEGVCFKTVCSINYRY